MKSVNNITAHHLDHLDSLRKRHAYQLNSRVGCKLHLCVNLKIYQSPSLLAENNTYTIHCILVSSRLAVMWHLYVVAVCLVGVPTVEHINGLPKKAVIKHVMPFGIAKFF